MPCAGHDRSCKSPLGRLWLALREAIAHRRQRRALGELDRRLLRDVGISEAEAARKAGRPARDLLDDGGSR